MMRPKGRHVSIREKNPKAVGICDYTGFIHLKQDLVRQMEYRGDRLVWTGFYVGKDYQDKPNQQLRPPMLPPDPIPVVDARLEQSGNLPPVVPAKPMNERIADLENFNWSS